MDHIKATTNVDLWWSILSRLMDKSRSYIQPIKKGSFAGEAYRVQLPFVAGTIYNPLDDMVPQTRSGIPPVTNTDTIQQYFEEYIIGTKPPTTNESYTYASRIGMQLPKVMDMLRDYPDTNQAAIIVGHSEDLDLHDPACLRAINFKVVNNQLELTSFWRSNDVWAGFPTNLGGLSLLLSHVAEYIGKEVGAMNYCCDGAHVYSYQLELVKQQLCLR